MDVLAKSTFWPRSQGCITEGGGIKLSKVGHQVISDNQEQWISSEEGFYISLVRHQRKICFEAASFLILLSKPYQIYFCFIRNSLLA